MILTKYAQNRYTTKAYSDKKISPNDIADLEGLLRLAPSSTNIQPWHFLVAYTNEAKVKISKSTDSAYAFNSKKILDASHVVIFCTKTFISEDHLAQVLDKEQKDGRFKTEENQKGQHNGRLWFLEQHISVGDVGHWLEKQTYLAAGTLLLGASVLGIDATPMEGFDAAILDREFNLSEKGLKASIVIPLGYRSNEDFNAGLPKSRLDSVVSRI